MTHRIHNFAPGPAALPLPVLEEAQAELLDFQGTGVSILEHSHRGPAYSAVHERTIQDLRTLLGPGHEAFEILFMGGGARSQFALVPMNLLYPGATAGYLTTGRWAEMALAEGRKLGDKLCQVRELWSSTASGHDRVPEPGEYEVEEDLAYLHYTSNNTVAGTQYPAVPVAGPVPLVCDMSSDIFSRPIDLQPFGLIYAGAQKNLGPAGVTVVVVRKDLLERSHAKLMELPDMFNYEKVAAKNSLLNTAPTFPIYMVGLVARWLLDQGGLSAMAQRNEAKAALLYEAIDTSGGFYRGHAQKGSRSRMNITFRLPSEALEARFIEGATAAGMIGLKGHRSVGGVRASIYNAVSAESVAALVSFMKDFALQEG
jgi:phosphoserine aminotransferase